MNRDNKIFYIAISILLFTFCWGMFISIGLPLFWEDFEFYYLDELKNSFSIPGIFLTYIKEFFAPKKFFRIGFATKFSDRPYQFLNNSLLGIFFNHHVIFYRIFKSMVLASIAFIMFFVINRISTFFALLGVFLYITSPEVWAALAYSSENTLYAQFSTLISIAIFLKLLEKKHLQQKDLWFSYILILITSQHSVLSKNDARYLAVIFLLTLFLFRRKELRLHLPMLIILLIFEIPILGYVKNFFRGSYSPVINIASHNPLPAIESLKTILKNYIFPLAAMGKMITAVLFFTIGINLFCLLFYKKFLKMNYSETSLLKEWSFIFFLWFICTFIMIAISRSFQYEGLSDISVLECTFFIAPFIIFLCYYACLVKGNLSKRCRYLFVTFCVLLMSVQIIIVNLPRLNHFRGGWGNYFCAWKNAEEYIDKTADNALVLSVNAMHYKPFIFPKSNNEILNCMVIKKERFLKIVEDTDRLFSDLIKNGYIDKSGVIQNEFRRINDGTEMKLADDYISKQAEIYRVIKRDYVVLSGEQSPFCDLEYIETKFMNKGYKDIFLVGSRKFNFRGSSKYVRLIGEMIMDGDCGDLYDRLKRFVGHPPRPMIYIYHFKLKEMIQS